MRKGGLDSLDIELLRLLIEDSSQSYIQLSEKLKAHKDTIRKRVKKLLELKIIEKFTISINQDNLTLMYPSLLRVVYAVSVTRDPDSLVKELLKHGNVIEVNEATPAAAHNILVQTEFRNMSDYRDFTNWLKSRENTDPSQLVVIPIYKQHRRRQRIATILKK